MSQITADLFGPVGQQTEKMNLVGDLEDFFYQEFLKLQYYNYPFVSEFTTRMNGTGWFNMSGGAGTPVDMIYFLSILFNDIISFDFTGIKSVEEFGVYSDFLPENITKKVIHFHLNIDEKNIPENTFSLICTIKYSNLINRENKTATVVSSVSMIPSMIILSPLVAIFPMLATFQIGALHAFSMCRITNTNDYFDNDTMYYYTNENVIKEQEVITYLKKQHEYINTLKHPFKEYINNLKQIEHPIISFFVINEPDTFIHSISINEDEYQLCFEYKTLFFINDNNIYLLKDYKYSKIQFVIQSRNLYKKTSQGVFIFVSNYDLNNNEPGLFNVFKKMT